MAIHLERERMKYRGPAKNKFGLKETRSKIKVMGLQIDTHLAKITYLYEPFNYFS